MVGERIAFQSELLQNNNSALLQCLSAFHDFWSGNSGATCPPIEKVGPTDAFEAAFNGEQSVGIRFRSTALRQFESAADNLFACAFHDAGSDRRSAFDLEVVVHSVRVDLVIVNADRDGLRPINFPLLTR